MSKGVELHGQEDGLSLEGPRMGCQFESFLPFLPSGGITMSGASTGFFAFSPTLPQ